MAANDRALVRFAPLARPVAFDGCRHLIGKLPHFFRNWDIAEVADASAPDPIITVARTARGYRLDAAWFAAPLERGDDLDAICALIAEVIRAHADGDGTHLCLHAAAVQISGRLVVFPSQYRAGKSLLAGCLAAHGMRVFADDVLPLAGPGAVAVAPGTLPRLRLPLPDNLDVPTRDFLRRHIGPASARYAYLDLPDALLAKFGEQADIAGFVLLERGDSGPAAIEPITKSRAMRQVIWQNFGREAGPAPILARLETAIGRASCLKLTYSRADDAARLLCTTFQARDAIPAPAEAQTVTRIDRTLPSALPRPARSGQFRRRVDLSASHLDGETYLADTRSGAIHHLDTIATAIWHLLSVPADDGQLAEELAEAFPDVPASRIADDVAALLGDLEARGLIVRN